MGNKSRSKSTIFDENTRPIRRMGRLYDLLMKDYRLKEGLNACIKLRHMYGHMSGGGILSI